MQVYEFFHAVRGLPAIITPYESYSLFLRRMIEKSEGETGINLARWQTQLQYQIARRFESFMFAPFKRTVVVSQRDKDELLGINPGLAIDVIPNGIDLNYFQLQAVERESATLLFTGNYEYAPNVDAALRLAREILPQVQASIPEAKLWLVGNAPTAEMRGARQRVGDCDRACARRAALSGTGDGRFVSPLRLGAGIKNKVLEALAMGCPLVATPLSVDGISSRPITTR